MKGKSEELAIAGMAIGLRGEEGPGGGPGTDGPGCIEGSIERADPAAVYAGGWSASSWEDPKASKGFCFFSSAIL